MFDIVWNIFLCPKILEIKKKWNQQKPIINSDELFDLQEASV